LVLSPTNDNVEDDNTCNGQVHLKKLLSDAKLIDQRFISLNKNALYVTELQQENDLRNSKINLHYQRLAKERM